jgi:hypothetical protein
VQVRREGDLEICGHFPASKGDYPAPHASLRTLKTHLETCAFHLTTLKEGSPLCMHLCPAAPNNLPEL